ncbi:MAG: hypothetical protein JO316_25455 [Abitibacteriaceae bacterium]|nr:hypothetical protein [Abditibacteriaceae bacterium]
MKSNLATLCGITALVGSFTALRAQQPPSPSPAVIAKRRAVPPRHRLKWVCWTEDGGYEWRGVLLIQGEDGNPIVYLCDPDNRQDRIKIDHIFAEYVVSSWPQYRDQVFEGTSRQDNEPLQFNFVGKPRLK